MSHKHAKVAALIEPFQGRDRDAHYLSYFDCFNRQLFFEAHEVLEELWLKERAGSEDLFYKGLIQLAGAFVHVQKQRIGPATALLRLARGNLQRYPSTHQGLEAAGVLALIEDWLARLAVAGPDVDSIKLGQPPRLCLQLGSS